jgi:hypothetical protein
MLVYALIVRNSSITNGGNEAMFVFGVRSAMTNGIF